MTPRPHPRPQPFSRKPIAPRLAEEPVSPGRGPLAEYEKRPICFFHLSTGQNNNSDLEEDKGRKLVIKEVSSERRNNRREVELSRPAWIPAEMRKEARKENG